MKILCPIPSIDFDPTEVAIPWDACVRAGHEVVFATPNGNCAQADFRMISGEGLGPLRSILMADEKSLKTYDLCSHSKEFLKPISYENINPSNFGALLLPGGHAKGIREYLESTILLKLIPDFFQNNKPVGAICHGTLLAARSIDSLTNKSVLFGKKTTGLTYKQEWLAWIMTCLWLKDYYRTYPMFMEKDLRSYLKSGDDFLSGPMPLKRDSPNNLNPGFCVRDGNYLSARWPGDANQFAADFVAILSENL